jgi:hypothetical protein
MYFRPTSTVCGTMLVLMAVVPVMSDDILTKSDWQYLKSKGYTEESYGLVVTTAEECRYLHKLINDPKTSGKKKDDAITVFVFKMSFDKTITPGKLSALGPCKN